MYLVDFAKNLMRKQNTGSIIYLVLNLIIYIALFGGFSDISMAFFAILLYAASLAIALSPLGEWILRMQYGCKKIKRKDYMDRLNPLFQEVYARAKQLDPSISGDVQLFMSNDSSPNAFATGRKTICITKGFMSYTDDQIKGTLAHEFGHLAHKDTDLLLLISVGNMLMSAIFVIYRIIIGAIMFFLAIALDSLATLIGKIFIDLLLVFAMWCWTKIGMLLVMHTSRQNEFEADKFAYDLGYGNALAVVLDSFEDSSSEKGFFAQLNSTHPDTNDRIAKLQELGAGYSNAYGHSMEAVNYYPEQYGYAHQTPPVLPPIGMGYNTPPAAPEASGWGYRAEPVGVAALAPANSGRKVPENVNQMNNAYYPQFEQAPQAMPPQFMQQAPQLEQAPQAVPPQFMQQTPQFEQAPQAVPPQFMQQAPQFEQAPQAMPPQFMQQTPQFEQAPQAMPPQFMQQTPQFEQAPQAMPPQFMQQTPRFEQTPHVVPQPYGQSFVYPNYQQPNPFGAQPQPQQFATGSQPQMQQPPQFYSAPQFVQGGSINQPEQQNTIPQNNHDFNNVQKEPIQS